VPRLNNNTEQQKGYLKLHPQNFQVAFFAC